MKREKVGNVMAIVMLLVMVISTVASFFLI